MEEAYAIELEDAVIGCVIQNPSAYDKVCGYFSNDKIFAQTKAKMLWKKIDKMKKSNEHIDLLSVCNKVTKNDSTNGLTKYYITTCSTNACIEGTSEMHAGKIYEQYLMRRVIEKSMEIAEKAKGNSPDVYQMINDAYNVFGEILEVRPSEAADIEDVISETLESINKKTNKLIKTNYPGLDDFAGGLTRGEITIIGGRPGHGKTTFLINLLAKVLDQGYKAIFFSRELPNTELLKKIICLESEKLSYGMVRKSIFSKDDLAEMSRVLEEIKVKYGKDRFMMVDNIRDFSRSSSEVRKFKPDIVFDDYVQLIDCKGKEDIRRLQIEKLVNDYKWLAKETKTAIVLASQLNRGIEHRDDGVPKLSDLAESGAIEQVAENVFFTYYDYKVKGEKGKGKDVMTIVASKVRYGDTGKINLGFAGDKCKLYNSKEEIINEDEIPF